MSWPGGTADCTSSGTTRVDCDWRSIFAVRGVDNRQSLAYLFGVTCAKPSKLSRLLRRRQLVLL